eukprot:3932175-Rhodomonas_salina.2
MDTRLKPKNKITVIKRDGSFQIYDEKKIFSAVDEASLKVSGKKLDSATKFLIRDKIEILLSGKYQQEPAFLPKLENSGNVVHVEAIQDCVEEAMMPFAPIGVCKEYILYREHRKKKRGAAVYDVTKIPDDVVTPWGEVGYVTFKRTYARQVDGRPSNETESFRETILLVLNAVQVQLGVPFTVDELRRAYFYMMSLKGLVSGRFLWQLGTETVERFGIMSLQNCAFVTIDEAIKPFLFTFDSLMLGTGVGVSVQREHVSKLPKVCFNGGVAIDVRRMDTNDADFIVPDKRKGWVALLEKVLIAFFETGESFTYSTVLIRNKGAPIKGFGGTASGAEDLCIGIRNIANILQSRQGGTLTSVDCLDIVNIIGSIVVAGNIRRSALIAIGDYNDIAFLTAKRWDLGNIPNWRAMSNNSVVCHDTTNLPAEFWDGYTGKGEPYGLINLKLARQCGRLIDGDKYKDLAVDGCNPCAEQNLCSYETCCLCEIFLPNIDTYQELCDVGEILYRICKHSLALKCHNKRTEAIVHNNMRMGIGMTGYMQASPKQQEWLKDFYVHIRQYDLDYSKKHGFSQERGYNCEFQVNFDGSWDSNTTVVSFPCSYPESTVLAADTSAVEQLEYMVKLNTNYSDNAVSCTVYYRLHELESIKKWLAANYTNKLKSCSFLLHSDHGFQQAPYEEISKELYDEMKAKSIPITA